MDTDILFPFIFDTLNYLINEQNGINYNYNRFPTCSLISKTSASTAKAQELVIKAAHLLDGWD